MATTKTRNYCLDLIKGIACIFVVFMHCEFPGCFGVFVQCISRFSVPFFFMVSGYFCYPRERVNIKKKVKHISIVILGAIAFYLLVTPIYETGYSLTLQSVIKWLVFNVPPYIASQLWFLFALLYDYLLFFLVENKVSRKLLYSAIPIGIILYILLAQGAHLAGITIPNLIYRNFMIEGFPLFVFGFYIHEHENKLKITNNILVIILVISTLLCPVERVIMGRDFGINIVSFPQVTALFLLGVNNHGFGKRKLLNRLGAKYSMYIYIIHPAVLHILEKLNRLMNIEENIFILYLLPILCLGFTILCSVMFLFIKDSFIIKRRRTLKSPKE